MVTFGCFHHVPGPSRSSKEHLPQVELDVHATVLSTTARTVITQTFISPSESDPIEEVFYNFPLYEDVSIVGFSCQVGDIVIRGAVKPKAKAEKIYQEAKEKGHTGAIFEQTGDVREIFKTRIGNVPAGGKVLVEVTLVEELKHDTQTNGPRYTVPIAIAPRFGQDDPAITAPGSDLVKTAIRVDISMEKGSQVRSVRSPSHPIQVDLGRTSTMPESSFEPHYASVKLRENVVIQEDFVLTVNSNDENLPYAMLETHPTLPNQRALMLSLVPQMKLSPDPSEIIFLIDRSASMTCKISTLKSALKVFLKSLPFGVPFNIVSFGSNCSALWPQSKPYNKESLNTALKFANNIDADMGGTEILRALQLAVKNGYKDKVLEVLTLTDGEVYNHIEIFDFVRKATQDRSARFFTLGIGNCVSHHLINGIARAGNGFSQHVLEDEALDKKVIRMLKGTFMPRLENVSLELDVDYSANNDTGVTETPKVDSISTEPSKEPMPLFDHNYNKEDKIEDRREALPTITRPSILQTPTDLPALFPLFRASVYLLLSKQGTSIPTYATLKASSKNGPLVQKIPIQNVGHGETIHQLAAKKAVIELEEGQGWIHSARDREGVFIREKYESRASELVQNECEYLGDRFQISGKYCSFVAVPTNNPDKPSAGDEKLSDWDIIPCLDGSESEDECDEDMGFGLFDGDEYVAAAAPSFNLDFSAMDAGPEFCAEQLLSESDEDMGFALYDVEPVREEKEEDPKAWQLREIIELQEFEGYWEWNKELLCVLRLDVNGIRAKLESEYKLLPCDKTDLWSRSLWTRVLATALVGRFLETRASETQDIWDLILEKGTVWSETCLSAMAESDRTGLKTLVGKLLEYYEKLS